MSLRVVIAQSDVKSAENLARYFVELGEQVWQAHDADEAIGLIEQLEPGIVVIDLHLAGDRFLSLLAFIRLEHPRARILFTSSYPDPERELAAREFGAVTFLQPPYNRHQIRKAMRDLSRGITVPRPDRRAVVQLPTVRVPLRVKITIPYLVLALVLAVAVAFVVSRVIGDSVESRFASEVAASGRQVSDWMVNEEARLLSTLRLVANTEGVLQAVVARDAEKLRELTFNVVLNAGEDAVEILSAEGESLLSIRRSDSEAGAEYAFSRGERIYQTWPFVQRVLEGQSDERGDKFVGIGRGNWGDYFYVAGPIQNAEGSVKGVVLVGRSLDSLVRQIREDTLVHVTVYDFEGLPLASTYMQLSEPERLPASQIEAVLARQAEASWMREVRVAEIDYRELVGPWLARGESQLGLIGSALAQTVLLQTSRVSGYQIFILALGAFVLVIAVGAVIANRITLPLLRVVHASTEVARGNLDIKVELEGNDEIAVLAHSFNSMIAGLREGSVYRDLLGRTVSPMVREELRQSLATGQLYLAGQSADAAVLMSDIHNFTQLTEHEDPTTVMDWLNEYYGELVPIIINRGGVVNTFQGDALMAFFGILPRPMPADQSAYIAARTAIQMLRAVQRLNNSRRLRGSPPFLTGIVVNTGKVTAGSLGAADRMHYTVIGDTVNTTQRLQSVTRRYNESSIVISDTTYDALKDRASEFHSARLGAQIFKGKSRPLQVYRLWVSGSQSAPKHSLLKDHGRPGKIRRP